MSKPRTEKLLLIPLQPLVSDPTPRPASPREIRSREAQLRARIHYVGFRTTEAGREYTLHAIGTSPRTFVVLITHRAFATGQARFQDGPDICCAKLSRVLAQEAPGAPDSGRQLEFTKEELLEYRDAHSGPSPRKRTRPDADSQPVP
jgi:hypothetical protein